MVMIALRHMTALALLLISQEQRHAKESVRYVCIDVHEYVGQISSLQGLLATVK